jgi:DNA-binding CsgD family transcriptional regulator
MTGLEPLSSSVIGRAAELDGLERLIERARHGAAGAVIVGEAGIGKTTVWEAGVARARERGFRTLVSRPSRADATLPLGSFGDLFRDVATEDLARLPQLQRRALEVALLIEEDRGETADQRLLAVATVSLLRALATAQAPVLLALDDVQWLDESSAAILAFAARRLGMSPIGFLLSVRAEAAPTDPLELRDALRDEAIERLELGPLSLAALHGMFVSRLGHSFPRLTLGRIAQASGGNPFYALEVGRALERTGTRSEPGQPLPIPNTLAELMRERVGALPARTRKALLIAAAAFEPTLATLAVAARGDPEPALRPAVRAGIVLLDATAVRFSHPLLADAVLAAVDGATLRRTHATLAASAHSEDARARHLGAAASGADEQAAAALELAAARARTRGASLDAVALYERASLLTPADDEERGMARAILAAQAAFLDLADLRHADAILERALERGPAGAARAEAMSLRGIVWYYHGRQADATSLCEQALEEARDAPLVRAKVLLRVAYLHGQVDMERSQAEILEATRILEAAGDAAEDDLLAGALLDRANAALQMATGRRRDDIARGNRLHSASGRSWEWERADSVVYELARHTDDLEAALAKLMQQLERRADRGGEDPFWFVHVSLMHAWSGDWRSARGWAERALEAYAREGAELWPAFALRGIALVDALQGRVEDARRRSADGLRLATASGDLVVAILHRQILGFVALSTGDVVEAGEQLEAAATLAAAVGARHPLRFRLDGDRAEVALALGETARAREIVERLEHAGRRAPTPWTLAVGARCRGLLEAAGGDLDAALIALERSLDEHAHLPMPFERGRTLLVKGQVHHRRKEKRLAQAALSESLEIFDELGAPLWSERVRPELARVGLGRRSRAELSETERRVAHLAADGLSNQEIAQRAFVSVKTVEASLTRVYRKLGVRSRSGLARTLRAAPPGDAVDLGETAQT